MTLPSLSMTLPDKQSPSTTLYSDTAGIASWSSLSVVITTPYLPACAHACVTRAAAACVASSRWCLSSSWCCHPTCLFLVFLVAASTAACCNMSQCVIYIISCFAMCCDCSYRPWTRDDVTAPRRQQPPLRHQSLHDHALLYASILLSFLV